MHKWDKRRSGKEHTICENCGGKIYWMGSIGTCTGTCSDTGLVKHESAKAICNELSNIKTGIKAIDLKLKDYDRQYTDVMRFKNKVGGISRIGYEMGRFSDFLLHSEELRAVVINAVVRHINSKCGALEVDRKKLVDKHTELGNIKWKVYKNG